MGVFKSVVCLILIFFMISTVNASILSVFNNNVNLSSFNVSFSTASSDATNYASLPWNAAVSAAASSFFGAPLVSSAVAIKDLTSVNLTFSNPRSVYVDSNYVYLADDERHRILLLYKTNLTYAFTLGMMDVAGTATSRLDNPQDVWVNSSGFIFVTDMDNHRVLVFNSTLNYQFQIGEAGVPYSNGLDAATHLRSPRGVAVDSNYIYVADTGDHRVPIFYLNGTYLTQWGTTGTAGEGSTKFDSPTDVWVDSSGNIFVADKNNHRVVKFYSTLDYADQLGVTDSSGSGSSFNNPDSVCTSSNYIFVADTYNHRIGIFNRTSLEYISDFGVSGSSGSNDNQLSSPRGCGVDSDNVLFVVDSSNNRVVKTVQTFPSAVYLDVGGNSVNDWSLAGNLSMLYNSQDINASAFNYVLSSCSPTGGNCSISFKVGSSTGGFIRVGNLSLTYSLQPTVSLSGSVPGFSTLWSFSQSDVVKKSGAGSPAYSFDLLEGVYDLALSVDSASSILNHKFSFKNVNLLASYSSALKLDNPSKTVFSVSGVTPLLVSALSMGLIPFTGSAVLNFSYSSIPVQQIPDERQIVLYNCSNWDFDNDACSSGWSLVSGAVLKTDSDYISTTQSSSSLPAAFAVVLSSTPVLNVSSYINASNFFEGAGIGVSGSVSNIAGQGIQGAAVYWKVSNATGISMGNGYTVSNAYGNYSFSLTAPNQTSLMTVSVTAQYADYINGSSTGYLSVTACDTMLSLCKSNSSCISRGGYWCNSSCQVAPCDKYCGVDGCSPCNSQLSCLNVTGCSWCSTYCTDLSCPVPVCSYSNLTLCTNQSACEGVGAVWVNNYCQYPSESKLVCSSSYLGLCTTEGECSIAGGEWCNGACKGICAQIQASEVVVSDLTGSDSLVFNVDVVNTYDVTMQNATIIVDGIKKGWYYVLPPYSDIEPDESERFLVNITLPEGKLLSDYNISYRVESIVGDRVVSSSIDNIIADIPIPPKVFSTFILLNDIILAGKRMNFRVNLHNARDEPIELNLTYSVSKGGIPIISKTQPFFLETESEFAQTLEIPVITFPGDYSFEVSALNGNRTLDVGSQEVLIQLPVPWFVFASLLLIAFLLLLYALKFRGRLKKIGEVEEAYVNYGKGNL